MSYSCINPSPNKKMAVRTKQKPHTMLFGKSDPVLALVFEWSNIPVLVTLS